jgi:hypothetical protein
MKKGDVIENRYAGEGNPHKYGIFLRKSYLKTGKFSTSPTIVLLHYDGTESQYYYKDKDEPFFVIVGHIDFVKMLKEYSNIKIPLGEP